MIALALIAAQPAIAITLPKRSQETETLPALAFDCLLHDEQNEPVRFKLKQTGGRAFVHNDKLALSPLVVAVSDQPSGKLSGYAFSAWGESQIQARAGATNAAFGSWIDLEWQPAPSDVKGEGAGRVALMLREFRAPDYGMKPVYRAVGFCSAIFTKQAPLSVEEARKYLKP